MCPLLALLERIVTYQAALEGKGRGGGIGTLNRIETRLVVLRKMSGM